MVRAMQAGQTRFDTCGTSASDRKASFRAGVLTRDAGPCHFDGRRTGFLEGHGGVNMDPPNLVGVVASLDGGGRYGPGYASWLDALKGLYKAW